MMENDKRGESLFYEEQRATLVEKFYAGFSNPDILTTPFLIDKHIEKLY